MKRPHLGILFAAFMMGGRALAGSPSQRPADGSPLRLSDVDPSNGIDAGEATAIAWAYFEQEYGGCGGPDGGVLRKQTWVFSLEFGATGKTLKETINVDAKTGGVWSRGGPRYRTFESFSRAVTAADAR